MCMCWNQEKDMCMWGINGRGMTYRWQEEEGLMGGKRELDDIEK